MVFSMMEQQHKMVTDAYDNLFSANHRNMMIERYGYTQAQHIYIEDGKLVGV